ncbi:MAG: hypothetical protein J2P24_09110 [Streptosporangiales bacterium]|nr:hypothetical protein [Streptosporangiales bacterium]MBO0890366.1 hypothetical protein [Acidothermales bacterium]
MARAAARWKLLAAVVAAVLAATGVLVVVHLRPTPRLYSEGIAVGTHGDAVPIQPRTRGRFVPGTSYFVATTRAVHGRYAEPTASGVRESRAWLQRSGRVLAYGGYSELVERALLDLRLSTAGNGALMASPQGPWRYVWPRDAAFAVAALSATGHHDDAERILSFLLDVCPARGVWQARYLVNGSGRVPDERPTQLDSSGWVPWATWVWFTTSPHSAHARALLARLWPIVARSADAAAGPSGDPALPAPSSDYWEMREKKVTLGTVGPLVVGLRAAAALARATGHGVQAARWSDSSRRLAGTVAQTFGMHGYPRTMPDGGADAAVTFLAPPFTAPSGAMSKAVADTASLLSVPNGGVRPGTAWVGDGAWTPEVALFALAAAGVGDRRQAATRLDWLGRHRTSTGTVAEKVGPDGRPLSVAPLAWTDALVVLSVAKLATNLDLAPPA